MAKSKGLDKADFVRLKLVDDVGDIIEYKDGVGKSLVNLPILRVKLDALRLFNEHEIETICTRLFNFKRLMIKRRTREVLTI